jgi:hypothetical protein
METSGERSGHVTLKMMYDDAILQAIVLKFRHFLDMQIYMGITRIYSAGLLQG